MGERGPIPKRSEERRRTNAPEDGITLTRGHRGPEPEWMAADDRWDDLARNWYEGLQVSGQARFYEQSDADVAYLLAEQMHRHLEDQAIVIGRGDDREVQMISKPMSGTDLSALLKGMSLLGATEADRRRMRIELTNPADDEPEDGLTPEQRLEQEAREMLGQAPLALVQGGAT